MEGKTGDLKVEVVVWERRSRGLRSPGSWRSGRPGIENRGLFGRLEIGRKVVEKRGRN